MSTPGYHNRYLRIDLSTGRGETRSIDDDVLRRYIGGIGLGTWLLHQETVGTPDTLAPEAPLIFVFSPLVGSPLTTSAKFAVLAKSPLTGRINDSLSSSHFAIAGKKTGFDAIVIVGRAPAPTCLVIASKLSQGGRVRSAANGPAPVELGHASVRTESAAELWGKSSAEAASALRQQLGTDYRIAAIGPAGENLVCYATISNDGRHAGRGGLGAVMGSKNLKAIAVRGEEPTPVAHPQELIAYSKALSRKSFGPATAKYRELGTVANLLAFNRLGTLPTRNFQSGEFAGAEELAPETINETHVHTRESCAACTIGCEHIYQLKPKPDSDEQTTAAVRMEYENLFALGPLCGISDPDVVLRASALCDELGLDTISAGATIAFAMECAERGYLDDLPGGWVGSDGRSETPEGVDLRFGNGDALLRTLELIGRREGIGDLLADGSRRAAEVIGHDSADFAPHVKGLELPGYEPRALQTMALGFAVGTRGADHNRSGAYQADFSSKVDRLHAVPDDIRHAIGTENEAAIMDSLILCKFLRGVFEDRMASMAEMLTLVTGWDVTAAELEETAARIVTAKKQYNIDQGWTPAEDTLPKRFLTQPLADGTSAGATLSADVLNRQIAAYNLARGWTEGGFIPQKRLRELQLD